MIKLLGCCVEKFGDNEISLCAKCYTIWDNDEDKAKSIKLKGVSLKKIVLLNLIIKILLKMVVLNLVLIELYKCIMGLCP